MEVCLAYSVLQMSSFHVFKCVPLSVFFWTRPCGLEVYVRICHRETLFCWDHSKEENYTSQECEKKLKTLRNRPPEPAQHGTEGATTSAGTNTLTQATLTQKLQGSQLYVDENKSALRGSMWRYYSSHLNGTRKTQTQTCAAAEQNHGSMWRRRKVSFSTEGVGLHRRHSWSSGTKWAKGCEVQHKEFDAHTQRRGSQQRGHKCFGCGSAPLMLPRRKTRTANGFAMLRV